MFYAVVLLVVAMETNLHDPIPSDILF